ncbi:MAG: GNAT family N-acetyltransferase [Nanoarchaeota archaeon]|nr:GNAT family N-acetyltransferase [Nanoarchaeota archaeon]
MQKNYVSNIIKLNKSNIRSLITIDFESEHQGDRERNISKSEIRKGIEKRFKKNYEVFFGYKQNNELVGYVTLKPFFPGHKHCEVYWLAVKKKCQGKGTGTKLMNFIEDYAKKKGFRKVCLYTGKDMCLTRRFYEKNGYSFINEFPDYYGYTTGNTTAVLYGKTI